MSSAAVFFIAIVIVLVAQSKIRRAHAQKHSKAAKHAGTNATHAATASASRTAATATFDTTDETRSCLSNANADFHEKLRKDPDNAGLWSEWGLVLLTKAQEEGIDPQYCTELIEQANSKFAVSLAKNPHDYQLMHEWAVELGYACANCSPEARSKYLGQSFPLAHKALEHLDKKDIFYAYTWAEMLESISVKFPEPEKRRLLQEALGTLSIPDRKAVDDADEHAEYFDLWIGVMHDLALYSSKEKKIELLEKALALYNDVPEDKRNRLPDTLKKRIKTELAEARMQTGDTPGSRGFADGRTGRPQADVPAANIPPEAAVENFAEFPRQDTLSFEEKLAVQTAAFSSPPIFLGRDSAREAADKANTPDSTASRPVSPKLSATTTKTPSTVQEASAAIQEISAATQEAPAAASGTPATALGRELPSYARPKGQNNAEEAARPDRTSLPQGYKPIDYGRR